MDVNIRIGNPITNMENYFSQLPTRSAVKDSLRMIVRRLVEDYALDLGATHLLLGRSMSSLSMALLSNVCSGRAFAIADERKSTYRGLFSFNPLQDVGAKECAACIWWRGLRVVSSPIRQPHDNGGASSISELTRGACVL